ncbi:hypothetical protein DFH05DRAFT_1439159 [Lentinula detonsa]|uniref:Transmembrane protein n=1 Tax=Lentinula detonsa TaxID=2804962 RepID=A0A9W8P7Y4_9AGAR|nr:hypothetical protein DFH05DRAFT_1439159 [Lentinula detonsa]
MASSINAIAGPSTTLVTPPAAVIHESTSSSTDSPISPFNAFFGYTLSQTATRESQHDRPLSSSSFSSESELLPPAYVEPPAYETRQREPTTLAMFLFKFGFLFPPFWIMGALILLTPLRAPEDSYSSSSSSTSSLPAAWLPEKTPAEKQQIISTMRSVEVKWAWRCFIALCILIFSVAAIVSLAWGILKVTRGLQS